MLIFLTMKHAATLCLAPLVLLLCIPLAGYPFDILPFHTQNQSPVVQIFGLPAVSDSRILPAGGKELTLVLDIANNYVDDSTRNEHITLDGETYRLDLVGRFGIGNRSSSGSRSPIYSRAAAFLTASSKITTAPSAFRREGATRPRTAVFSSTISATARISFGSISAIRDWETSA